MPLWKQTIFLLTSAVCLLVGIPLSILGAWLIATSCSLSAACIKDPK